MLDVAVSQIKPTEEQLDVFLEGHAEHFLAHH